MDRRTALKTLLALPAVQSIEVATLQPDDVLVIECDVLVSAETNAHITAQIARIWPDHKVIIFEKGSRLRIARHTVLA
jgi:hypothetical protein